MADLNGEVVLNDWLDVCALLILFSILACDEELATDTFNGDLLRR
jgi:hypothetical protein